MARVLRWALIGFAAVALASLLYVRGGLGEYVRGGSVTTAHLGACTNDIWHEEDHITCPATWDAGGGEVRGTVRIGDANVRLPAAQLRVFADGTTAVPADPRTMAIGAGVLAVLLTLLGWEAFPLLRRTYGAAGARRGAFASSRA
ncbi:hypothetical protein ACPPVO_36750 [Dactylosporangium sp. McL0621]|uniref:hypothetical protein n=1 Tax=Dactylosporangium sp. McL0621 TaxID=3415678 RepID=UPI003CF216FC